jgi:hypothetical protein
MLPLPLGQERPDRVAQVLGELPLVELLLRFLLKPSSNRLPSNCTAICRPAASPKTRAP